MFIDGKLRKTNFTVVLNICNLLRAAESLESFLHIPMIASAKKKEVNTQQERHRPLLPYCRHNRQCEWLVEVLLLLILKLKMCQKTWEGLHSSLQRSCLLLTMNLVTSHLFNLPLYMTKRLNMFHQSCYSISPIFH